MLCSWIHFLRFCSHFELQSVLYYPWLICGLEIEVFVLNARIYSLYCLVRCTSHEKKNALRIGRLGIWCFDIIWETKIPASKRNNFFMHRILNILSAANTTPGLLDSYTWVYSVIVISTKWCGLILSKGLYKMVQWTMSCNLGSCFHFRCITL